MLKRLICAALVVAGSAGAQNFTTQAEVQPILESTRANWVAVGSQGGADLLYFTHLLAWRCGVAEIRYGLNGDAPEKVLAMEPCHHDSNTPNAIRDLPFVTYPPGSIEEVTVELVYPDGATQRENFARAAIRLD